MKHPTSPGDPTGIQDHHGGGINIGNVLVGFNLFPLEWSMGWGAKPELVTRFAQQLIDANLITQADLDAAGIMLPLTDIPGVMKWVDSHLNANIKLCAPHHVGHQTTHDPDANGHESVGIHN